MVTHVTPQWAIADVKVDVHWVGGGALVWCADVMWRPRVPGYNVSWRRPHFVFCAPHGRCTRVIILRLSTAVALSERWFR